METSMFSLQKFSISRLAAGAAVVIAGVSPGLSQSADSQKKLDALYVQQLASAGRMWSINDGFRVLGELEDLELDRDKLPAEARGKALAVEAMGALAIGDAARAWATIGEIRQLVRDPLVVNMLTYRAAVASGDAKAARESLDSAASNSAAKIDAKEVGRAQAALDRVGMQVPSDLVAKLSESGAAPRRAVLVDFWSAKSEPVKDAAAALSALNEAFSAEIAFELVGVNTDAAAGARDKQLAEQRGYTWKQHFAGDTAKAATKLLQPKEPPWQVLIDSRGVVRAVGSAGDPGFVYAVRAAVAEARGDFSYVAPVTVKGQRVGGSEAGGVVGKAAKKEERPKSADELPSNPDAERKLNTARAFMKTGKKTDAKRLLEEIIRDYPNTREAKLAEEFLGDIR
jgi:thioredoxin-like negative regulator of GroEL